MPRAFPSFGHRGALLDNYRAFPLFGGGVLTVPPVVDPSFASVVLLSGFDGTNGNSLMVDESSFLNSLTAIAPAQLDTSSKKFGDSALLLDGSSGHVVIPDQSYFSFPHVDFTMEAFINTSTANVTQMVFAKYSPTATTAEYFLDIASGSLNSVLYYGTGNNSFIFITGSFYFTANTFHHVAIDRSGDTFWLYANGTVVSSWMEVRTLKSSTETLWIGGRNHGTPLFFRGRIDEARITNGVARYAGSPYTVPNSGFPRS